MSNSYTGFNMQNCAPPNCRMIAVYNEKGKVGFIKVPERMIASGQKQYSFCAFADAHLTAVEGDDAEKDFIRAVLFAENSDADFSCFGGDVIDGLTEWILGRYKSLKDQYAKKPIRVITGNHETHTGDDEVSDTMVSLVPQYYGDPFYYSFEHGNDVFIMLGEYGWSVNTPFAEGELQFLYDTLEANRNKRCFVFFHVFNFDENDSGQPNTNFYGFDIFALSSANATQKQVFINLLKHYKNAIWFHAHSHAMFQLQEEKKTTVYSEALGYRSVHIPSLSKPKNIINGTVTTVMEGSQGYMVDVYDNFIVLKGRDFAAGKFLPIATYKIDTTLQTVAEKTFVDTTGILNL